MGGHLPTLLLSSQNTSRTNHRMENWSACQNNLKFILEWENKILHCFCTLKDKCWHAVAFSLIFYFIYRFLIFTGSIILFLSHANGANIIVRSYEDKFLIGYNYRNISIGDPVQCLQRCLADCPCLSFQICNNKTCLLSNASQDGKYLQVSKDCNYQDFEHNTVRTVCRKPFHKFK